MYKTSILVFKDRDKYVSGEYRYRHGYCRSNPRKMVKVRKLRNASNIKITYLKKKTTLVGGEIEEILGNHLCRLGVILRSLVLYDIFRGGDFVASKSVICCRSRY